MPYSFKAGWVSEPRTRTCFEFSGWAWRFALETWMPKSWRLDHYELKMVCSSTVIKKTKQQLEKVLTSLMKTRESPFSFVFFYVPRQMLKKKCPIPVHTSVGNSKKKEKMYDYHVSIKKQGFQMWGLIFWTQEVWWKSQIHQKRCVYRFYPGWFYHDEFQWKGNPISTNHASLRLGLRNFRKSKLAGYSRKVSAGPEAFLRSLPGCSKLRWNQSKVPFSDDHLKTFDQQRWSWRRIRTFCFEITVKERGSSKICSLRVVTTIRALSRGGIPGNRINMTP